jgi:hypothetical protein
MRTLTWEQWGAMLRDLRPPSDDDVSVTTDGRWLDSKEAVLRFFAELQVETELATVLSDSL